MLRTLRRYWPLLAVPPVAVVIHGVLLVIGDPWAPGEWASNVIFAYVVTLATVTLSRRQEQLQESSADNELVEKIASVTGALDRLHTDCHASTARQILLDSRAGLHLVRFADAASRAEYLQALCAAVVRLRDLITGSVRPYSLWSREDWLVFGRDARRLREALIANVRRPDDVRSASFSTMQELLQFLGEAHGADDDVPFEPFERSFRHGDVSQRVRVLLDWDLLRRYASGGMATVTLHREWSLRWLERHDVFSVWYANPDKSFASYYDSDVHPIALNEVDDYYESLPEESKATIESMARSLELRQGALPTAEIVTLELAPGKVLVLDGNHRVAAIRRGRGDRETPLPVNIVEYRLRAPRDPQLLPDISHHLDAAIIRGGVDSDPAAPES